MTDQITAETVEWARTHNWGKASYFIHATAACPTGIAGLTDISYNSSTGLTYSRPIRFASRRALREWAGY
jgi:hypothetical protein